MSRMSPRQHGSRMAPIVTAALLALALAGCAPAETGTAEPPAPTTAPDDGGSTGSGGGGGADNGAGDGVTDGPVDPVQETRRSGPSVEFGGPPFGAQGDPEEVSAGVWCVTVGFFWGGEAPPENVTFTVAGIVADPAGAVTAEPAVCGSVGAEETCIGFVMAPDTPFTTCSLLLTATEAYPGSAEVGFAGTLECTEPAFCDAAIERDADRGPPIRLGG